jgi:RNA polymerase sigma-70 factor (ECF subfamily)
VKGRRTAAPERRFGLAGVALSMFCQAGHVQTTEHLLLWWTELEPSLKRLAQRYAVDSESGSDLVQDLAVLVLQKGIRFDNRDAFAGWARARLRWLALDRLRLRTRLDGSAPPEQPVAPMQEQRLIATDIWQSLSRLPQRQQTALRLTLRGLSNSEIAEEMGITEATVRSLLRFARQALAAVLSEEE